MLRAVATVVLFLEAVRALSLAPLVVLAACGAPPRPTPPPSADPAVEALPGHRPGHRASHDSAELVTVPRPEIPALAPVLAIAPPDPSDHVRWPLTANRHPALEPSYAIAPVFADPGVSWVDLCRLGAQNRRTSGALTDQTEYLKAWCDVSRREITSAVTRLGALAHSPVLGLPTAVRLDIANILVDAGDASEAQRVLAAARVADLAVLDLLAASYIEVGKIRDGAQLNELALGSYDFRRPADQCERITRRVLLLSETERALEFPDFTPYLGNHSCMVLANEVRCWAKRDCAGYLAAQGIPLPMANVASLYFTWPASPERSETWLQLADLAYMRLGTPGADTLATAAWEGALRSANCDRKVVAAIRGLASHVLLDASHDTSLDPRLEIIIDKPRELCHPVTP